MSENYVKSYEIGNVKLDAPRKDYIYELPLLAFGDVQHSVGLSLVFNSRFADENPFYIASGYKFNVFKRLILDSNSDKPVEFEDGYGKCFSLIDCVDKFAFDDDSQRIIRKTGDGKYEIHYPDLSIEEYDRYGRIYHVKDKYGVTYLNYYYSAQGKLESIAYRADKIIRFNYSSVNGLLENVQYVCDEQVICTSSVSYPSSSNLKIAHYTGVDYHLSYSGGQFIAYSTDSGSTYSDEHSQRVTCVTSSSGATVTKEIGSKIVDRVQYEFLKLTDSKIVIMDITDFHGIKTRMHFSGEYPVYSYETSDNIFISENGSAHPTYFGKVSYHVKDQIAGTQGYTDGTKMTYFVDEYGTKFDMFKYPYNIGNAIMISGWLKANSNVEECNFYFYNGDTLIGTTAIKDLLIGSWVYFSVGIPEYAFNNMYVSVGRSKSEVEMTDFRLIYNDNDGHNAEIEALLFNPVGEAFSIKDATFYFATEEELENANSNNDFSSLSALDLTNKYITENDVLKYQLSMAIGSYVYEGYLCDCREIFYRNKPIAVKLGEYLYDLTTIPVGKQYKHGERTYLTSNIVGNGDVLLTEISCVNGVEISRQEYNTYLDVVLSESDGLATVYQYLSDSNGVGTGLVTRKTVGSISTNAAYDLTDFRLVSTTDEYNVTTTYTTDTVWGAVTKVTCDGESVEDEFDNDKSVLEQRTFSDAKTHNFGYSGGNLTSLSIGNLSYGFTYDRGSLATVSKCSAQIEEHALTDSDKVLTSSYPNSNSAIYSVIQRTDNYGRLTKIDGLVENTYDVNPTYLGGSYNVTGIDNSSGRLATGTDKTNGNVTKYAYNNYGVSNVGIFDSSGTKIGEDSFEYDSLGRLTKNTYAFDDNTVGNEFTYLIDESAYNADRRIGSAKYKVNGTVKSTATNYYDSYKRIRRKLISIGNTYDREITYSGGSRISRVLDVKNGSTINNLTYTYDAHGRITGESDSVNTSASTTYVYDSFGQLIRENNKALDKTFVYSYNEIGNITSVKTYAYTTAATPSDTYTEQAYGYNNTSHLDRLTSFGGKGVSYNTLGYPISHDGMSYVWTKGKLTRQYCGSKSQAGTLYKDTTFTYDAYGRRLSKSHTYDTNPALTSDYSYTYNTTYDYDSSGRLVHETCVEAFTYSGGTSRTREIFYLYDKSNIVGAVQTYNGTTETFYLDRNIKGDVIGIFNSSGTKVASYVYDAWGNCTTKTLVSNSFSSYNPIRYRGYYYDRETGLYYLIARYYNPQWRRFISPDSTEYLDPENSNGLNLYCYCNNDPVNYADPSGCFPVLACIFGLTALIGMGLTIGGVASDNNVMTAVGLTMVAVPALISGVGAIFSGATYLSIIGCVTIAAGIGTGAFATAEYQEAFTGNNWMLDAGMSEEWYTGLMLATAAIATAGTIATGVLSSIGNAATPNQMIDSISNHPNRWRQVKEVKEAATGRKYRGATSYYRNYINKWTGSRSGSHIIVSDGKILHKLHYHSWIV